MKEKRYDVFISHSSKDKKVAFTLCKALENEGLICWIAPRDVGIGHYASSIVEGVEESKIFVLILSKNSNSSTPVLNEIEMAMGSKLLIIPMRIEDILPTKAMKFYLMATNWFDVLKPKSIEDFDGFVSVVKQSLDSNNPSTNHFNPPDILEKKKTIFVKNILTLVALAVTGIGIYNYLQEDTIQPIKVVEKNESNPTEVLVEKLVEQTKETEHWKQEYFKLKEKYKNYPKLLVQAEKIKDERGFEEAVSFYLSVKVDDIVEEKDEEVVDTKEVEEGIIKVDIQPMEEEKEKIIDKKIVMKNYNKKALLIANFSYQQAPELEDPSNSLNELRKTLEELNFDVIVKKNLTKDKIQDSVMFFSKILSKEPNSIGLVYYAGHGYQVNNESYLVPIDINPSLSKTEIAHNAFNIKELFKILSYSKNDLNMYFLDTFLNTQKYLPPIPPNTILMYASNGKVLSDNNNFITSIIKQIKKPMTIEQVVKNIQKEIAYKTDNEQIPIVLSNSISSIKLTYKTNPASIGKIFALYSKNKLKMTIKSKINNQEKRAFCKGEILTINIEDTSYLVTIILNNRGQLILMPNEKNFQIQVTPPFGTDNLKVFALKNKSQFDKILKLSKQFPHGILNMKAIEELYQILISNRSFREQEAHILTIDTDIKTCLKEKF
jgi:hypothetical protein